MSPQSVLIISTLPDRAAAETVAAALVQRHAAACVNIMSPCSSVYRWKGAVEQAEEVPLFIKTTDDRYELVERIIRELHPYELPEIIALPIQGGLPAYLEWVTAETRAEN